MIYLSGHVRPEVLGRPDLGVMLTPMTGYRPDLSRSIWAADSGCFSAPEKFDMTKYLDFLALHAPHRDRCLFATAPDVVGDAEATLEKSAPYLPIIRGAGYRVALVAQDGLEVLDVPWEMFDCLFVGGTTAWKLSEQAYQLAREADERGKWVHMGRVNSWRRLKAAAVSGYDSADGTFLAFGPEALLPRMRQWIETLRREPVLGAGN